MTSGQIFAASRSSWIRRRIGSPCISKIWRQ